MSWRISVSVLVVSSKPGVSMRTTLRLERVKGAEASIIAVQERRPSLVRKVEPDTRLMNYGVDVSLGLSSIDKECAYC